MSDLIYLGDQDKPLDEFSYMNSEFRSVKDIERFYSKHSGLLTKNLEKPKTGAAEEKLKYATELNKEHRRRDVFLWRYLMPLCPNWVCQYQRRGTCVGQGYKLGTDTIMAINHRFGGFVWKGRCAVADVYAGGRVDIAGRPGNWDGSNGSWAKNWRLKYGTVLLSELDLPDDAMQEDERLAVRWTGSREGVPGKFEEIAKEHPVTEAPLVTETDQVDAVLDAGGVVVTCTSLIASGRRDQHGFSPVSSRGGHCELIWGKFTLPDGRKGYNRQNSWSSTWGSGPKYPADMPDGSVNLTERAVASVLRSRDCYALMGIRGFDRIPDDEIIL